MKEAKDSTRVKIPKASNDSRKKQATACGTWVSPLSAAAATGSNVGLSGVSADGGALYWLESRPAEQGRTALVRRSADGVAEDVTPLPVNVASRVHEYGGGAYAVQGGRIVYSEKADSSVWVIENGAAPRQISAAKDCRYADFAFIPSSDDIVCVREDHRDRKPNDPEAAIVHLSTSRAADAATNEGAVLVKGPDFLSSPRPSPDGKRIAWLSWSHPDMPWDATQLHVAGLTASGVTDGSVVAGGDQREAVVQPEWSPEGSLYFCTDRTNWWNIHRLSSHGKVEPVSSVPDGEIGGPHWVFGERFFRFTPSGGIVAILSQNGKSRAVAVEKDGQLRELGLPPVGGCPVPLADGALAFIATPAGGPPEVDIRSGNQTEIVRTAGPQLLDDANVSEAQEITFPSANGEEAHAFYYAPVNATYKPLPDEKPPLIVMIHGGPTSTASTGFSAAKQYWTTRGFAVADVNYRGSTGYGREYRQKLDGNWGVADVEDCIAVVKHLVAAGKVDPDRVAIRGGSAGGFTVLAALTTSDAFRAGASLYGIGDLRLMAEETHKFESRYLDRLLGQLPQADKVYQERSPINHLDRLSAAVIFFQGLDDKVVPPSQAQMMVEAMRERNLPVAHYEFAGEAHGFRKAETQRRVLDLELGFYAKIFGFQAPGRAEDVEILGLDN